MGERFMGVVDDRTLASTREVYGVVNKETRKWPGRVLWGQDMG